MEQFTAILQVSELENIIQSLRAAKHYEGEAIAAPVQAMSKELAYRASAALMEHITTALQTIVENADKTRASLELQVAASAAARKVAKKQGFDTLRQTTEN